jgi:hypothetical protein
MQPSQSDCYSSSFALNPGGVTRTFRSDSDQRVDQAPGRLRSIEAARCIALLNGRTSNNPA